MNNLFRCLSISSKKKGEDSDESENEEEREEKPREVRRRKKREEADEVSQGEVEPEQVEHHHQLNLEPGNPNECANVSSDQPEDNVDDIQVIGVIDQTQEDHEKHEREKLAKKIEEQKEEAKNLKQERHQLVLAQIALAEESARLRRKEKREKKRMELSKYLGINAWKCDQKFLLNYGQEPEDIKERIVIIRKRNVKKERQRRIDEFVIRAEISNAARRHKKKS